MGNIKCLKKLKFLLPVFVLCLMMIAGTDTASAAALNSTGTVTVTTTGTHTLATGVTEETVNLYNKTKGYNVKGNVIVVKANAKAKFVPTIPDYYDSSSASTRAQWANSWSDSWYKNNTVSSMVSEYQGATGGTVLAAVNADFCGKEGSPGPRGSVILEGNKEMYHSQRGGYSDEFFFAVKKNGKVTILQRTAGTEQKSQIQDAVCGGAHILRNGELYGVFTSGNTSAHRQRCGVGIKPNGDVLIITLGNQNSTGISVKQFAELMQASGCWNGLNFDGGGSTTMVTKRSGESIATRKSDPCYYSGESSGGERYVCSSLMVVADNSSTAAANKVPTSTANTLTTDQTSYTAGSNIYVTANSQSPGAKVCLLKQSDAATAEPYYWYYAYGSSEADTWSWENGEKYNIFDAGMCTGRDDVTSSMLLPAGNYKFIIKSTSNQVLATRNFTVTPNAAYSLATDKAVYGVGDPIWTTMTAPSSDDGAWLGITRSKSVGGHDATSSHAAYYWYYNTRTQGSLTHENGKAYHLQLQDPILADSYNLLDSGCKALLDRSGTRPVLLPGTYDICVYSAGGYAVQARKTITIVPQNQKYTVTYKNGNATLSGLSPTSYTYAQASASAINLPTNVTLSGHKFVGWYTNSSFTGEPVTTIPKGSASSKTFYAKFDKIDYTVNFDTDGGTEIAPQTVGYGSKATQPATPTKTGYTFAGWVTAKNGSTTFNFNNVISANTTVYAKWTPTKYSITYKDGSTTLSGLTPTSYTIEGAATLPASPSKTGFRFLGWYTDAGFSGNPVTTIAKGSTGAKTFYAKFEQLHYTVSFVTGAGTAVNPQTINHGSKAVKPANPTRSGCEFVGWMKTATGTTTFDFNTAITSNTTIYAKWRLIDYTITFDANGAEDVSPITYNVETETFTLPDPVLKGHAFMGWQDEEGNVYDVIETGFIGSLSLTAQWQKIDYILANKATYSYGEPIKVTTYNTPEGAWVGLYKYGETPGEDTPILKYSVSADGGAVEINNQNNRNAYDRTNILYPVTEDRSGNLISGTYQLYVFPAEGNFSDLEKITVSVSTGVYAEIVTAPTCTAGGQTLIQYTNGTELISGRKGAKGHDWVDADCDNPKHCSVCDATEGEALGHDWAAATCDTPKTCKLCETTSGKPLEHDWTVATCTTLETCKLCEATQGELLEHSWIDADCENPKTCEVCGATDGVSKGHTLKGGSNCTDPVVCMSCTKVFVEGTAHTPGPAADCVTAQNCIKCGVLMKAATGIHDYEAATCTTPEICKVCGHENGEPAPHVPGKAATCLTEQNCTKCGEVVTPAKGHTPGDAATCTSSQECTVCHVILNKATGHTPGDEPTCTSPQRCTECQVLLKGTIAHTPGAAATCTTPQTCTVCNKIIATAKGHTPGDAATCTTAQTCTVCHAEITKAKGHTVSKDATCTEAQVCTVCHIEIAKAKDHIPSEEATCKQAQTCLACGVELAPKKDHTPGPDATCTKDQACTVCQTVIKPASGHKQELIPGKEATCMESGLANGWKCTVCQEVLQQQTVIPVLPHSATVVETIQATMDDDGKVTEKCVCGKVMTQSTIRQIKTVKLSFSSKAYDGKVKTPTVTVKDAAGKVLKAGVDYTVKIPTGRKVVGTYTYTITFKGNYDGEKAVKLTIKPKTPTIVAPKAAKQAVTVKWKKISKQITGYQVMVATDKKFEKNVKKAFVKKAKITSKKMTKLQSKKTYYVKVRTYKTVKGVKIYSNWSKVKTVKTK